MLPITWVTVRLFLHVLAATIWVGGQFALAGLVPVLRPRGSNLVRAAARRFNQLAWPAFGVLVVTGIWNLLEIDLGATSIEYQMTLAVKLVAVTLSGACAAAHTIWAGPAASRATTPTQIRRTRALSGALGVGSVLFATAALLLGVLLGPG